MLSKTVPLSYVRPGRFPGIVFKPDGDEGGVPPTPTDENPTDPSDDDGTDPQDPPKATDKAPAKVDLTSAQLKERLNREAGSARTKLLKDLGFKDEEEAKTRLTKLIELEKAQMTEKERLEADLKAANERAEELQQVVERELNERKAEKRDNALKAAMKNGGVAEQYTDITLPLLQKHVAENFGEDAELKPADLKDFLTTLKTEKPGLFGTVEKPADDTAPKNTTPKPKPNNAAPSKKVNDMTPTEYHEYKKSRGWA